MPQLDQVTFLTQFFWVTIFFFAFYLISVQKFLPKIASSLKIRQKYGSQLEMDNINYTSNTSSLWPQLKLCSHNLNLPINTQYISTKAHFESSYFNRLGLLTIANKQIYSKKDLNFVHSSLLGLNIDPNSLLTDIKPKTTTINSTTTINIKNKEEIPAKRTRKRKKS